MDKYENHREEWREEENERKYNNRYRPYVDPRDPCYVAKENCGRCGEESEQEVCESCLEIMLLGAPEYKFQPDENFFQEIGVKRNA